MKTIGKYKIFAEIHKGPITTLYKAFHSQLDRFVLIKQLNSEFLDDDEINHRFQQEGLIIAKINHSNIVSIFDYGKENEIPFLVMEFIEGITLADLLKQRGSLPISISVFILNQVCSGLAALHKNDFIHRDIKPDNILISNDGNVKLGDFGFAESKFNTDSLLLGTPAYMSPELILSKELDERSDLFALGIILYEMLSGNNPFLAKENSTIFKRIINLNPLPVNRSQPKLPDSITKLCEQMLQKDVGNRIKSASAILKVLTPWSNIFKNELLADFLQNPDEFEDRFIEPVQQERVIPKLRNKKIIYNRLAIYFIIGIIIIIVSLIIIKKFDYREDKTLESTFIEKSPNIDSTTLTRNEVLGSVKTTTDTESNEKRINKKKNLESKINIIRNDNNIDNKTILAEKNLIQYKLITIDSDPRAWIIMNDDSIGITPVTKKFSLSENPKKRIIFKCPGFPLVEKTLDIKTCKSEKWFISIWKEIGYLKLDVQPWGEVWIDDDSVDVTPLSMPLRVSVGKHRLMIKHPQLKFKIEAISITPGDTLYKNITLL